MSVHVLSIFQVETVKDSFVGVSGAPERVQNHAENILMMALDMRDVVHRWPTGAEMCPSTKIGANESER